MEPNSPTTEPDSTAPATLQKKLAVQKDAYLRLAADFENFQKRTRRDSEREAAAEKESFIRELLPVLDNLERALASEDTASSGSLYQGVEMVWQQWIEILHRHGLDAVEALGQPFDPHQHEAVSVQHDPSQLHHTVLKVLLRGYRRGDHLFRPAKVIVNDLRHSPGGHHAG
jgi:molecular chaperone GrpE